LPAVFGLVGFAHSAASMTLQRPWCEKQSRRVAADVGV